MDNLEITNAKVTQKKKEYIQIPVTLEETKLQGEKNSSNPVS